MSNNCREIIEEIVDEIFECPYYSEAQIDRAEELLEEKFKENRKEFARDLLNLSVEEVINRLQEEGQ